MLKKTVSYTDLDGNPVVEDFYFHMTQADIAEAELGFQGGLTEQLKMLLISKDQGAIMRTFREIIANSVGMRSADNKQFIKTKETRDAFMQSEAYSTVLFEILQNPAAAVEFIKGIVPASLAARVDTSALDDLVQQHMMDPTSVDASNVLAAVTEARRPVQQVEAPVENVIVQEAAPVKKIEHYSDDDLLDMSQDDFDRVVGTDPRKMNRRVLGIAFKRRQGDQILKEMQQ